MDDRARKMEKIKKLLAMGKDSRGNAHEIEAAMRQANKLMAELGIEEAEINLDAIKNNTMEFGEQIFRPDGKPLGGKPKTGNTKWCAILAMGVAVFTDCMTRDSYHPTHGYVFKFQGEKSDVTFAVWLFQVLCEAVNNELKAAAELYPSYGRSKSRRDGFRTEAAAVLQHRMKALREERNTIFQQASAGTALMVIDQKKGELVARFGEQKVKQARGYGGEASSDGRRAGQRINIPTARPIGHNETRRIA